ncbi:MAG: nucleotidyl transferase AbiEii/AbiGii toxin family protein [Akkermansia sp.]
MKLIYTALREMAKSRRIAYPMLCQQYAMERFLFRLGNSRYANYFYLKGGMLLLVFGAPAARPTLDIDLLGNVSNSAEGLIKIFKEILLSATGVRDGVSFSLDVQVSDIIKEAEYVGKRILFSADIQGEKFQMKIDIGFGDSIHPEPCQMDFPSLIDVLPPIRIFCYTTESLIAEKWQAMISLGSFNSRMKDFYDIWMLSRSRKFNGNRLREAVYKTFKVRHTDIAQWKRLTDETYLKIQQPKWTSFLSKMKASLFQRNIKVDLPSKNFVEMMDDVLEFLAPIMNQEMSVGLWEPKKGWSHFFK